MSEISKPQNTDAAAAAAAAAAADKARARQGGDAAAAASANAAGAGQLKDRSADSHPATGADRTGSATGKQPTSTSFDRYLADSGRHPAQDATRPPAQPRTDAADSRSMLAAPQEKSDAWRALYPELRANLAPLGVTAEQARTYVQLVNTGTERGDQPLSLQTPDMQRVGHAVNLLPEKLRLELFAQVAKPGDQPAKPDATAARPDTTAAGTGAPRPDGTAPRVTLDTGKLSAGQTHFGFDPPLIDLSKAQKTEYPPSPPPTPNYFGKTPTREPSGFDKYQPRVAAAGTPGHRTPDAPWAGDPINDRKADIGKFVKAFSGPDGPVNLKTAVERNASELSAALRNPATVLGLVTTLAPILLGGIGLDVTTQRRPVIGAPEQTPNGLINPTGSAGQLLEQHLITMGGLPALDQLLGLVKLPGGTNLGLDGHVNLAPVPPKDATGPRQQSDIFFGINWKGKLP